MADTTTTYSLKELYWSLKPDEWRRENPFSEEMTKAQRVINHPFEISGSRERALTAWLQRYQPCLFGRVAAVADRMHYCILTDEDLQDSDQSVQSRIHEELLAWKRRSLRPTDGFSVPAHGFILLAASERLALAAPDEHLRAFSEKLRDLWGCRSEKRGDVGEVYFESLYLKNPTDSTYRRFTFSLDFFAAQGDGRWWADHRVPGGIAFTANSVGHMRLFREWYEGKEDQVEWATQTAMLTISEAAKTPFGSATTLLPLVDGKPYRSDVPCPFKESIKDKLKDKDWTTYGGHLHTDHSIRPEFFSKEPDMSDEIRKNQWLADFTYLYDQRESDFHLFSSGEAVSQQELNEKLGDIQRFARVTGARRRGTGQDIPQKDFRELSAWLAECEGWRLNSSESAT